MRVGMSCTLLLHLFSAFNITLHHALAYGRIIVRKISAIYFESGHVGIQWIYPLRQRKIIFRYKKKKNVEKRKNRGKGMDGRWTRVKNCELAAAQLHWQARPFQANGHGWYERVRLTCPQAVKPSLLPQLVLSFSPLVNGTRTRRNNINWFVILWFPFPWFYHLPFGWIRHQERLEYTARRLQRYLLFMARRCRRASIWVGEPRGGYAGVSMSHFPAL